MGSSGEAVAETAFDAASPGRLPQPEQSRDRHRGQSLGPGIVDQAAQHLVVPGGADAQVLTDGSVLGPRVEPPGPFEFEDRAGALVEHGGPDGTGAPCRKQGFRDFWHPLKVCPTKRRCTPQENLCPIYAMTKARPWRSTPSWLLSLPWRTYSPLPC